MNNTKDMINRMAFKTLLVIVFLLLAGCNHHQDWVKVDHPGSLELINMGYDEHEGNPVRVTKAHDKIFLSYLEIKGPSLISTYLLENTEVKEGESVLDMGTGSGIQAIYAAKKASHVLAVDIVERSIRNTMINARLHGVEDKITARKSDLFNNIRPDEKFDVIISNIPFPKNEKTQDNWKLQERFFRDVGNHLTPDGRIYFLSGLLDNLPHTRELVEKNNLKIVKINMTYVENEKLGYELFTYLIKRAPATSSNKDNESV
jgi:release factor glutamine methyltransferase